MGSTRSAWPVVAFVIAGLLSAGAADAQSFSCPFGREPACLDYGDQVVDQSAACFDSFQCDYEGFTCKSNVTACTADYEALLKKHDSLVDDYNALLDASQATEAALRGLRDCLYLASTTEDVRRCAEQ
jgi:hypothetical protein